MRETNLTIAIWYRIDYDLVTLSYINVQLTQAPVFGVAPNTAVPKIPVVNVMSTHPCKLSSSQLSKNSKTLHSKYEGTTLTSIKGFSINTAAEATAAGFKHYYRSGNWFHIFASGAVSRVVRDTTAPTSCTANAGSNVPSGINCGLCLADIDASANTGGIL